jgi:hypothetical protein
MSSYKPSLQQSWKTDDFVFGFTPLAKDSNFKAPETHPSPFSHLLHSAVAIECMKGHLEDVQDSDLLAVPTWQDVIAQYLIVKTY